jgi:IS605 OrfB family transposase
MIRATRSVSKKKIYESYKRAYAYAKGRNRNWDIVNQRWSEWSKNREFRARVKMPIFKGDSIILDREITTIYTSPKTLKNFDLAVKLSSIWGNRFALLLPMKKHASFNKHIANGFTLRPSVQLHRIGGEYFMDLFLEKETLDAKDTGSVLGIDVGIKKLMSTSDGKFLGRDIEKKIQKLKRRKSGSKNSKQTIVEIKNYIGQQVNKLELDDVGVVVVEDLDVKSMMKKDKSSKEHRKTLGNWNSRLLFGRLSDRCKENRVLLATINPGYTSQQCSSCGEIHKESRMGERYECVACKVSKDADYNAALNIRNRFLNRESLVPRGRQQRQVTELRLDKVACENT